MENNGMINREFDEEFPFNLHAFFSYPVLGFLQLQLQLQKEKKQLKFKKKIILKKE